PKVDISAQLRVGILEPRGIYPAVVTFNLAAGLGGVAVGARLAVGNTVTEHGSYVDAASLRTHTPSRDIAAALQQQQVCVDMEVRIQAVAGAPRTCAAQPG